MQAGCCRGAADDRLFVSSSGGSPLEHPKPELVELCLPVREDFAYVLRLATSGIATRFDFTWDEIEDLKTAVEEGFLLALKATTTDAVDIAFKLYPEHLEVVIKNLSKEAVDVAKRRYRYSNFIMNSMMDQVALMSEDAEKLDLRLVKKRAPLAATERR